MFELGAAVMADAIDRARLERMNSADNGLPTAATLLELMDVGVPVVALPGGTDRLVAMRLAVQGLERAPVVNDVNTPRIVGMYFVAIS
ncbi:hypothetical protein [Paraburkholderia sp. FT54]|uniref:hypothetical protein n=1 Tax=Paraburkholderia sp. FT54 TaxID=3074437 RepID=UPI0038F65FBF